MSKSTALCLFSLLFSSMEALETKPWLGEMYAFWWDSAFSYTQFSRVEGARVQPGATVHSRDLLLDLGFTPLSSVDAQLEAEFGQTESINWALRSGAFQARLQLWDDISGDPLSLVWGVNARAVPSHFLKSVSTPYASEFNGELTCSVGKEWGTRERWETRAYGFACVGQGNKGYPWTQEKLVGQLQLGGVHRISLFLESLVGFGRKKKVDVTHFRGWAPFQHQSVDIGFSYGYKMGVYGVLSACYTYRVFAHQFPEQVHFCALSYHLPFSLF